MRKKLARGYPTPSPYLENKSFVFWQLATHLPRKIVILNELHLKYSKQKTYIEFCPVCMFFANSYSRPHVDSAETYSFDFLLLILFYPTAPTLYDTKFNFILSGICASLLGACIFGWPRGLDRKCREQGSAGKGGLASRDAHLSDDEAVAKMGHPSPSEHPSPSIDGVPIYGKGGVPLVEGDEVPLVELTPVR